MTALAEPPARAGPARAAAFTASLLAMGAATVAALAVGGGNPVFAALPVALVAAAWGMARAPLRWSASVLVLLMLSLEISSDASGLWHTPLAALGDILQDNLERSARLPGVVLSGLDVLALYLLGISLYRRAKGSTLDGEGFVPVPSIVVGFLVLYVAGTAYADLIGLLRGGSVAFWKLRHLLQIPLLVLVFQASFRGPSDYAVVGRIVVVAASIKALLGTYVQHVVAPALTGGEMLYATNHGDSILFCLAAFLLVVNLAEREDRASARSAALFLPLILLGLGENARRTAWVMLAVVLFTFYLLGRPRPWKRALTRGMLVAIPILLLYVAIGWDRSGSLFAPVQVLRSLSDSSVDSSTRWRDVENWNLAMSMREHPLLGLGLGHEYTEFVRGDDISAVFSDFKGWPHNSVLGLLLFAGPIGFTAMWSLFGCVVFLAIRSYRMARGPEDRVAAMACIATIIVGAVLAFGDTGAHHAQYRVLTALALAVSGKLAVVTGAWPAAARRPVRRAKALAVPTRSSAT